MASRSVLHRTDAAALRFQVFSFAGVFFARTAIGLLENTIARDQQKW
jgi:hypothetical protein